MAWPKTDTPRYNHIQTRLNDEDYDALRRFAHENDTSYCDAARALIVTALHLVGVRNGHVSDMRH